MDFKGHWEMDRDLISEFIQQQKGVHSRYQPPPPPQRGSEEKQQQQQLVIEDEDDAAMLKCLPSKLIIDESPVDDPFSEAVKPCNNKEALSITSLKSKFDENVKAIWSDVVDGNDLMKPLTQKHFDDDGCSASLSLASSFTSEKNSLSLFNFSEQTITTTSHHFEVNAPAPSEIYHHHQQQHQLQPPYKNADYDNSNNPMAFYGGRGAMTKSSSSFTASPNQMIRSDFIKSGTNLLASIWSDGDFPSDAENLVFKEVRTI
jgi:hypothetical protein